MSDQEKLKDTLSAIFRRRGQEGKFTRAFEDLDPSKQKQLLQNAPLHGGELPVVAYAETEDRWLLLTTDRVVWRAGAEIQSVSADNIRNVDADLQKLVVTGRRKDQMRELRIVTMDGECRTLEAEQGAPMIGLWNALRHLAARARKKAN